MTSSTAHGQYLMSAADHHAVYLFTQDRGTTSACTGQCSLFWPALKAPAHPVGGPGVDSSKISVVNGQVAYNGHLLYEYRNDSQPGQTNGSSVQDWYLVTPAGNKD
ncbi:MAG: COG4315 family predicted lipoprotein [Acidimicrobiales bacterium]